MGGRRSESGPAAGRQVTAREALASQREATTAQIAALAADFETIVAASAGVSADDEHDPEGATIAYERAQVAGLLEQARHRLDDIEDALARLADGRYGICERCGRSIGEARLAARPTAATCLSCAAARRR